MNRTFTPLDTLSKVVAVMLVAVMVTDLLSIWALVHEIQLYDRFLGGEPPRPAELRESENRMALTSDAATVAFVAAVLAFLAWFVLAYRNLPALGATGLRYGWGWALGGWFVPILNFWRPKQIANDLWRASDPDLRADMGEGWRGRPVPGILRAWWILGLASLFAIYYGDNLYLSNADTVLLRDADYVYIAGNLTEIAAAVLSIVIVMRITGRQEGRQLLVAQAAVETQAVGVGQTA